MRIKQLRTERKLRQADVARILNVTPEAYSMWENGVRQMSLSNLVVLARFYGVTLEYLVGISSERWTEGSLSSEEESLLVWYKQLDDADKGLIAAMARNLAANKKYDSRQRAVHGCEDGLSVRKSNRI